MKLHNRVNGRELKAILQQSDEKRTTLSFYKYFHFANPELVRNHLFLTWDKIGVMGRIYIAHEGINGQISIPDARMEDFNASCSELEFMNCTHKPRLAPNTRSRAAVLPLTGGLTKVRPISLAMGSVPLRNPVWETLSWPAETGPATAMLGTVSSFNISVSKVG